MTLEEFETQLLIAQSSVEAAMCAFREDPVIGLEGDARREAYDRLREAERGVTIALDEVRAVTLASMRRPRPPARRAAA